MYIYVYIYICCDVHSTYSMLLSLTISIFGIIINCCADHHDHLVISVRMRIVNVCVCGSSHR